MLALALVVLAAVAAAGLLVLRGSGAGSPESGSPDKEALTFPARPAQGRLVVGTQFSGTWSTFTDSQRRTLLDNLVSIGVRTVRISISWAMLQPQQPVPGDAGWSWGYGIPRVDRVVSMARARGLLVHATFGRTPGWANGDAGEGAAPTYLSDWRRAVGFVARRYADKVTSWEVWNEPNLPKYFVDGTPESYTRLLCSAYPVLRRVSETTPVVYGGLSGNDWRFLQASYEAGVKGCFDILAVHPYQRSGFIPEAAAPNDEPWYFPNVSLVRDVQADNNDLKPVWFTEFGWSTHPNAAGTPEYDRGVTRQQQASYLVRTLRLTQLRYPYVERAYIYTTRDERVFDQENNNFGLYTLELEPKPAVAALRNYLSAP